VGKRRKNQECIEDEALETWNDEADAESDSEDRCHPVEGLASGVGHLSDYETAADVALTQRGGPFRRSCSVICGPTSRRQPGRG
jgi:hypothetical protein